LVVRVTQYLQRLSGLINSGEISCEDAGDIRQIVDEYIELVGVAALRGWSPEYTYGTRLADLIDAGCQRYHENIAAGCSPPEALSRLAETEAVRLLTVHKAKGLEFDIVVFLAIEQQTFWADLASERAVFFVGISRAKHRLVLTTARRRTRPPSVAEWRWPESRTPQSEFLSYATRA
jgi:ATP-dependent exoDNAse (exonuclease V) beta subunit